MNTRKRSTAAAAEQATEFDGSLEDFIAERERQTRPARMSPATIAQYRNVLLDIWKPWFVGKTMTVAFADASSDELLDAFTDWLQGPEYASKRSKPLSVATVRTYVRVVSIYLRWAKAPTLSYKPLASKRVILEVLSRDEIDAMERTAIDERDRLIVRVLADSGLRVGELVGLRAGSLGENARERLFWLDVDGKTGVRRVPLNYPVWKRLKTYATMNAGDPFIFMGQRRRPGGNVEPLGESGVTQMLRLLAKQAGVRKRVYSHLFRHSFATHMLTRKMSPITLMNILGHKSLEMIARNYSHLIVTDTYSEMIQAI